MSNGDCINYCRDLIASSDEDFWLSLAYAEPGERSRLAALFAFLIELRRIPSLVSEPPLGEIRLQWWRDALDEILAGKKPRAHPVVEALAASGAASPEARQLMEELIDARARIFYERDFTSLEDLGVFLNSAEAPIVALAAGGADPKADKAALAGLGQAYGLARFAPGLNPALSQGAADQGLKSYLEQAPLLRSLAPSLAGRVAFLALTRGHAIRRDGRPWPVVKRLTLFGAVLTGRF